MEPDKLSQDDALDIDPPRARRPWFLIAAGLLLAVLVVVLWSKWAESRTEAERLRVELKQVYAEAEALRTESAQARRRVSLLEQQVRALTAERERILKGILEDETPKTKRPPARRPHRPR